MKQHNTTIQTKQLKTHKQKADLHQHRVSKMSPEAKDFVGCDVFKDTTFVITCKEHCEIITGPMFLSEYGHDIRHVDGINVASREVPGYGPTSCIVRRRDVPIEMKRTITESVTSREMISKGEDVGCFI